MKNYVIKQLNLMQIYNSYSLHDFYVQLKEQHPDMFEHPRDLYKLYFIDNINNIQED